LRWSLNEVIQSVYTLELFCMRTLTRLYTPEWITRTNALPHRCYMCIQWTCVLYSVVTWQWQSNPPISQVCVMNSRVSGHCLYTVIWLVHHKPPISPVCVMNSPVSGHCLYTVFVMNSPVSGHCLYTVFVMNSRVSGHCLYTVIWMVHHKNYHLIGQAWILNRFPRVLILLGHWNIIKAPRAC